MIVKQLSIDTRTFEASFDVLWNKVKENPGWPVQVKVRPQGKAQYLIKHDTFCINLTKRKKIRKSALQIFQLLAANEFIGSII